MRLMRTKGSGEIQFMQDVAVALLIQGSGIAKDDAYSSLARKEITTTSQNVGAEAVISVFGRSKEALMHGPCIRVGNGFVHATRSQKYQAALVQRLCGIRAADVRKGRFSSIEKFGVVYLSEERSKTISINAGFGIMDEVKIASFVW